MATSVEFIEYVCEQLAGVGDIRYQKMFGEYLVYVNEKPIVVVCDNTAFVKQLDCILDAMKGAETGFPYKGAKEHFVLEIDNGDFCKQVVAKLEKVTPLPKKKKKS